MNEAESPVPEIAHAGVSNGPVSRPQSDDGLPERVAHLNVARAVAPLAGDILHGADAIAAFLYGDKSHRRKVYNLVETARLPVFRLGVNICARKSVLLGWIEEQERRQAVSGSLLEE